VYPDSAKLTDLLSAKADVKQSSRHYCKLSAVDPAYKWYTQIF